MRRSICMGRCGYNTCCTIARKTRSGQCGMTWRGRAWLGCARVVWGATCKLASASEQGAAQVLGPNELGFDVRGFVSGRLQKYANEYGVDGKAMAGWYGALQRPLTQVVKLLDAQWRPGPRGRAGGGVAAL